MRNAQDCVLVGRAVLISASGDSHIEEYPLVADGVTAVKPSLRVFQKTILPGARRVNAPGADFGPKRKSARFQSKLQLDVDVPSVISPSTVVLMISAPGPITRREERPLGSLTPSKPSCMAV